MDTVLMLLPLLPLLSLLLTREFSLPPIKAKCSASLLL